MASYVPPSEVPIHIHHEKAARARLAFYAAVSVRATELPDGTLEPTFYLYQMASPGSRLTVTYLGRGDSDCGHMSCQLGSAVALMRFQEADLFDASETEDLGQGEPSR